MGRTDVSHARGRPARLASGLQAPIGFAGPGVPSLTRSIDGRQPDRRVAPPQALCSRLVLGGKPLAVAAPGREELGARGQRAGASCGHASRVQAQQGASPAGVLQGKTVRPCLASSWPRLEPLGQHPLTSTTMKGLSLRACSKASVPTMESTALSGAVVAPPPASAATAADTINSSIVAFNSIVSELMSRRRVSSLGLCEKCNRGEGPM